MKCSIFEGSTTAVVASTDEYGNLDLDAMGRLLDWLLEEKTGAIVVDGITREFATLDDNEKMEMIGFVTRYMNRRVPMIAGAGSNYTEHTVKPPREAEELGANALLRVTPYYNKASQEGLVRHFTQVGDHVGIPVILCSVPSRAGATIQLETYRILLEHSNIRGAKKAGGNMSTITKTAVPCGDGFDIYSGNDDQTIPIMALGDKGVIPALANIMSRQTHDMCRLFLESKLERSRKTQLYLLDTIEALFWDVNPIPVKAVLSIMGMCMDSCRLLPTPIKAGEKAKLEAVMKRYR